MTEASRQALENLRSPANMQWYVVPLLVFVIYVYITEAERGNWSAFFLGIAAWGAETIWEMFNALILHFSGFAPLWTTPGGNSSFILYAGLNIEITFFFAAAGPMLIKALPKDRDLKIGGIPNRFLIPVGFGFLAVFVETLLNQAGLLVWSYSWWKWPNVWLILVVYCMPWYLLAWCHDHLPMKSKARGAVIFPAAALVCHLVFATWLGWI